jgi:small subunit ribosomal protein S29
MATKCIRCLARPSLPSSFLLNASSSLRVQSLPSTASMGKRYASKLARPNTNGPRKNEKVKGQKTLRIKKKPPPKTGKPPQPGERKAMRKRIVLSNTNALEVPGMRELDKGLVGEWEKGIRDARRHAEQGDWVLEGAMGMAAREGAKEGEAKNGEGVVGHVVALQGQTVDSLRAVEAFKTTQGWGLFRRPGLLIREESVMLSRKLIQAEEGNLRLVIDGERGTGKSLLLLHAMATAFVRGWIVINIPQGESSLLLRWGLGADTFGDVAQEVTNAMNDYAPLPNTNPKLYTQPTYTATLLSRINKANPILADMEISLTHSLPIPIQSNISLSRLCELGARDPDVAWPIFQAFWAELMAEGMPPVLLSLDGLSNIMRESMYLAPDTSKLHAHDLALVDHFVNYLSGERRLENGGAVLAATSRSHAPNSKSMELVLKQLVEIQRGEEGITEKDPFEKSYDDRVEWALGLGPEEAVKAGPVEVLKLKGLSKKEARGLMEYWAKSGVLRKRVDEKEVAEKWALAGNGVVAEIERGALRMRI